MFIHFCSQLRKSCSIIFPPKKTTFFANSEPLGRRVPQHLGAFAAVVGFAELPREQLCATARVQDDGTGPAGKGWKGT